MARMPITRWMARCSVIVLGSATLATLWAVLVQLGTPEAQGQRPVFAQRTGQGGVPVMPVGHGHGVPAGELPAGYMPPPGYPLPPELQNTDILRQSAADAAAKSAGCITCHQNSHDPHFKKTLNIGCCDCHGGNPQATTIEEGHVWPRFPDAWRSSANPVRTYALLNHEDPMFIRFVNPGDLRIAHMSCGLSACHPREVLQNKKSMMTHGCMLWGAALYNNGSVQTKWSRYGESYSMHGVPQRVQTVPPPTAEEMAKKGVLPFLDPLPRFEISQPGNILRIFERGGKLRPEIGNPEIGEDPGRPFLTRLSNRGLGTENRTDPVFIGLAKTRLLDPTLNFLGTNDHPGDYRSSGCTSCHVIYANDRSLVNSGPFAKFGNMGTSFQPDPTIPRDQPGHPIEHRFTTRIPTSQCIVCHIHPGTNVLNTYVGMMWWDEETDGELIYPAQQKYPTSEEFVRSQMSNPNESAARNNLSDPEFLAKLSELNPQCKHTQFADFHGHGWAFRAVFKRDRKGNLLDHANRIVDNLSSEKLVAAMVPPSPEEQLHGKKRDGIPVHMMDIHLEKGMHCIDCHFIQDNHGDGKLYGEVRAAMEIQCVDCHGSVTAPATLRTSGPAAQPGGRDLAAMRVASGQRRFVKVGDQIIQRSMVEIDKDGKAKEWVVKQVVDVINPTHKHYNQKADLAKTVRAQPGPDGRLVYGNLGHDDKPCAHQNGNMSCIACHSSWNPSCFGCHLPQKANKKTPNLHFEGDVAKNYTSYNFQTLRDDVYMMGRDGDVTGNRIGPVRSACAIHVGSYNANRESIYYQQQTISGEGLSGIAFSSNVPHTVRGVNDTKQCTDCHCSKNDDNNAIMAQLLMQGTGYVNFIGRYVWTAAGEHGMFAVVASERDEPQAVIGSTLHRLAFPDYFAKHEANERKLKIGHEHPGRDISDNIFHPLRRSEVLALQHRGEYLYCACGEGGVRVFDISMTDHKGFSERTFTAPVSPIGQKFFVPTKYCTSVAAPTTIAPDPTRAHYPENREQAVAALYAFIYATDKYEGLICIGAGTLLDGNPLNNYLKRDVTFNPDGILTGAKAITIVGEYAYISANAGLVVVHLKDPTKPEVTAVLGHEQRIVHPHAVACQFRYAYVCDKEGIKVLDITDLAHPRPVSMLPMKEAHNIYLARTYAYVAAGSQGIVILDIERAERPRVDQVFNAGGCLNDCHDIKLGITYTSEFAYVADGKNGLRVVQLTNPEMPDNHGFSPRPQPELVATFPAPEDAHFLAVARGVDRDRAVDEAGNQIAVFGRVGARPFNLEEQLKMYFRNGKVWKVSDDPQDMQLYRRISTIPAPATR